MGLKAFTPTTNTVLFPGGDFVVRGLSLEDITVLLRAHYDQIKALFDKFVTESSVAGIDHAVTGGELGIGDVEGVALEALEKAPALLGDVIARAADEPELAELARKLPVGVQIDAIEKIVTLTLEAEGGMEKLAETVSRLTGSMAGLTASLSS